MRRHQSLVPSLLLRLPFAAAALAAVAFAATLAPVPAAAAVTIQLTSDFDDYRESATGHSYHNDTTLDLWSNADRRQAYRFTNSPVPQGATVLEARLELWAGGAAYVDNVISGTASGQAVGNAPAWTGASYEITNAAKTSATVAISNLPVWTNETYNFVADVKTIVQEIVNRGDYAQGNALKLFLIGNTAGGPYRRTKTADSALWKSARLILTYAVPTPYRVRPVYFVAADDNAYDPQYVAKLKNTFTMIRQFYASEMQRNGFGYRVFNMQTEADNLPKIHFVRGQQNSAYYAADPRARIQTELEGIFDEEHDVVVVISKFGPWNGGGGGSPRGGYAFVEDLLASDHATTYNGQLALFCDQSVPPNSPPGYEGATRAVLSSVRFGGIMHELGHAFGVQHQWQPLDVVFLGFMGAANYFTGNVGCVWSGAPVVTPGTALILNNSAFFRSETLYTDFTKPTLSYVVPSQIEAGEPMTMQFTIGDADTTPAVLVINFNGASYPMDVSTLGNNVTFPYTFRFTPPLQPGTYQIGFELFDASANRLIDDQQIGNPAARTFTVLAPHVPTVDPGEVVWMEDAFPTGALTYGSWNLQTLLKASGTKSHKHPSSTGFRQVYFEDVTTAAQLPAGATDTLTAWVYIAPGATADMIGLQWRSGTDWKRAYWGADRIPTNWGGHRIRVGDMPPTGGWVRLRVPVADVGLSGLSISGFAFMAYGAGDIYVDRIGKVPAIPATHPSEIVFAEDGPPAGSSTYGLDWQTAFKMTGTASHKHIGDGGFVDAGFFDASSPVTLAANDKMTVYVYLEPGSSIDMIRLWWRIDDGWLTAHWGANLAEDYRAGEVPPAGSWVRLELPASDLHMEGRSLNGFQVTTHGTGTMYVDRIGRRP